MSVAVEFVDAILTDGGEDPTDAVGCADCTGVVAGETAAGLTSHSPDKCSIMMYIRVHTASRDQF